MVWDERRFFELESKVTATAHGRRPVIDVPYYRFFYDPELERICMEEFRSFAARLRHKGISVEIISLGELFVAALEKLGCLKEEFLKFEKRDRKAVFSDLERELPKEITQRLIERLGDKDVSHCVILMRAGALFPFVHISRILSSLEGHVHCTLVVPYPGKRDGEMLNYRGEAIRSYYRGEAI